MSDRIMKLKNDILTDVVPNFDFSNPPTDPTELAYTLCDNLIHYKGVGLAANQLGLPYRAFAVRSEPMMVMFNPRIVWQSEEEIYLPEGCLSYPGLMVKIKRAASVRVRFTMPNGRTETKTFDGLSARIIQHELDHLNGVIFYDRATRFHLEQARRQAKRRK